MDTAFDAIVIGAGVVGLACAAKLAATGSVLVLERHAHVGQENSARNSGVIHAGVHHPSSFLKTRLCVRGRELLIRRCVTSGIPHRRTGKLIVALSPDGEPRLTEIARHASEIGIECHTLDGAEVARREPAIRAHAALHVPCTTIVSASSLVRSLHAECEALGATVRTGTDVIAIEPKSPGLRVVSAAASFVAPRLVIAGGTASDHLAVLAGVDVAALGIVQRFVRGTWCALHERHRHAISRVVYPLPEREGLGIHLTPDLDGHLLAGPDAEPIDTPDFSLRPGCEERFRAAIAPFFPAIGADDLRPHSVGVRPKLGAIGDAARDFAVLGPASHAREGLLIVAGIESPGLTACLAIAEEVAAGLGVYT